MTVLWLYRKFKVLQERGVSDENIQEAISSISLAYDNMCHVDSVRISKVDLPFPSPFSKAWKLIPRRLTAYTYETMWIRSVGSFTIQMTNYLLRLILWHVNKPSSGPVDLRE